MQERDDRGVSLEMSTKFTLEERLPLLMIHSYLHLLG
jgi:ssRNA-specific RNase YbeY (16S rRNA maturation enzyme)